MERPSRLAVLVQHAQLEATRGTCSRLQVGAVIHRDGRILSTGYNGSPSGVAHCNHACNCYLEEPGDVDKHILSCQSLSPCTAASHAERNAIDWAARYGNALLGSELVTTDTPCAQCAGSVINAGILSVVSVREYRDPSGVELLRQAGVSITLFNDRM